MSLFLIFTLLTTCGKSKEEDVEEAISGALIALNSGNCRQAITILETVGRQPLNALYVRTLASAYACRAGYNTSTFISVNVPLSGSPSPFGGFARYTTSSLMTSAEDRNFTDLMTAIDVLTYAGNLDQTQEPTKQLRNEIFGPIAGGDINALLFYLTATALGEYLFYFGNSSINGVKGTGGATSTNICIANYNNAESNAYINTVPTGTCTNAGSVGHPDLGTAGSLNRTRMCTGVVLTNTLISLVREIATAGGTSFTPLLALEALFNIQAGFLTSCGACGFDATLLSALNISKCASDHSAADDDLQLYFAYILEPLFL